MDGRLQVAQHVGGHRGQLQWIVASGEYHDDRQIGYVLTMNRGSANEDASAQWMSSTIKPSGASAARLAHFPHTVGAEDASGHRQGCHTCQDWQDDQSG